MTMVPLVLARAAGAMSASYSVCLRLAAGGINPALGALIVSATALPFSLGAFIAMRDAPTGVALSTRGTVLMILAGSLCGEHDDLRDPGLLTRIQAVVITDRSCDADESRLGAVGVVALDEPLGPSRILALALIALGF